MTTGRTKDLTFAFTVERQDDEGWPWVATVESIEPRDPENCGRCSVAGYISGGSLCDACSARESMDCMGPEDWLEHAGIKLDREGTLVNWSRWE